jgi:hypothetical protein
VRALLPAPADAAALKQAAIAASPLQQAQYSQHRHGIVQSYRTLVTASALSFPLLGHLRRDPVFVLCARHGRIELRSERTSWRHQILFLLFTAGANLRDAGAFFARKHKFQKFCGAEITA